MRVSPDWLSLIDGWRRHQDDLPPRSEAIRRLVDIGIKGGVVQPPAIAAPELASQPTSEPVAPQLPPLDLPTEMREKIEKYRDSRPWFGTDDDAIRDLIKRGLELAEGRDDMVELDQEQVRQLRHLYPKGELGPIISGMVATGIRTALLNREDDK